ncbi:uncharacterized protein PAC_15476 [Phialocephala subalpina]|uniref:Uncharacterized protein n=1 Tax=Phialocephala subalpina TaxID=576137 RepID=A0A1L7XKW7_9HELO|nr:uncharacterized protein PAC_15476 [Phialocephala subalpina]
MSDSGLSEPPESRQTSLAPLSDAGTESTTITNDPGETQSVYRPSGSSQTLQLPLTNRPQRIVTKKRLATQARLSVSTHSGSQASLSFHRPEPPPPPASISSTIIDVDVTQGTPAPTKPRRRHIRPATSRSPSIALAESAAGDAQDSPQGSQGSQSGRVISGTFAEPTTGIPPKKARAIRDADGKVPITYNASHGSTNTRRHLKSNHKLVDGDDDSDPEEPKEGSVYSQIIHSKSQFSVKVFRWKLLRCIAILHLPFAIVKHNVSLVIPTHNEFRDLLLYSSPYLRNNDALPKSGTTIKRVAGIFRHFENPQRLTVFQPAMGRLSVEMRHLELSFFVNKNNLLECRELHAEIDPNQDAGTLYGFLSKIVLRDVANTERRSIITPLGQLTYKRHGMHVAVRASSTTEYGRFGIDDVLGRLSCPPEPRLLYSKAQFHAFTSFILPDPLTGRTGTEEALHTLREYYPKDKRRLQTVTWDQHLTMSIQHDSYEGLVQEILAKSDQLQAFNADEDEAMDFDVKTPSHLRRRGEMRCLLYERGISGSGELITGKDVIYKPRDRYASLPQATNVYQIVGLVCKQPFRIHITKKLAAILQDWNLIGGFHDTNSDSESISSCLSDLMENNIGEQWGSLVNLCRHTDPQDSYRLMFRLALLSFGTKPDMDAIQSLAAFGCLDELKSLQPPLSPCSAEFKLHASPTLESLLNFIAADYPVTEPDARKSRGEQDLLRESHRILCEAEGRRLASFLLKQWPSSEPSAEEFRATVINVELALERILPEWQRLHRNMGLSEYVIQAQEILNRYKGANDMSVPRAWNEEPAAFCATDRGSAIPQLLDLLVKCAPLPLCHLSSNHGVMLSKDLPRGGHSLSRSNISRETTPPKLVYSDTRAYAHLFGTNLLLPH